MVLGSIFPVLLVQSLFSANSISPRNCADNSTSRLFSSAVSCSTFSGSTLLYNMIDPFLR